MELVPKRRQGRARSEERRARGEFETVKRAVTIKENYEFRRLYAKGKSAVTPSLVLYCRRNGRGSNRVGVTASKKLGCAVVRNRARRRLRELFRLSQKELVQGYDVILVARGRTAGIDYRYLKKDYDRAVRQLGLLRGGEEPE